MRFQFSKNEFFIEPNVENSNLALFRIKYNKSDRSRRIRKSKIRIKAKILELEKLLAAKYQYLIKDILNIYTFDMC